MSRTRIVCLHEGEKGRSIDPIFIRTLLKALDPLWIRPWNGNNVIRLVDCGGRTSLIAKMPAELKLCSRIGSDTTLMVWADLDHDMSSGEELKQRFWIEAQRAGIAKEQFEAVVFIFAKDRLENWIEFLNMGATDESREGVRVKQPKEAAQAGRALADLCIKKKQSQPMPISLLWSCNQWYSLVKRMTE